jgi:hypothetical protein
VATPFGVTYSNVAGLARRRLSTAADFTVAEDLTIQHIKDAITASLSTNASAALDSIVAQASANTGATTPPTIAYTLTVYFLGNATQIPSTADIDVYIANAFEFPTVRPFLSSLAQTGGGFSACSDAIYSTQNVPAGIDDEIPFESLGEPNEIVPLNETAPVDDTVAFLLALGGTFTLLAAITAAVALVQRRRATQKEGDPDVVGEGNTSPALVRNTNDKIQPTIDESGLSEEDDGLSRSSSSSSFFMSPKHSAFQPV